MTGSPQAIPHSEAHGLSGPVASEASHHALLCAIQNSYACNTFCLHELLTLSCLTETPRLGISKSQEISVQLNISVLTNIIWTKLFRELTLQVSSASLSVHLLVQLILFTYRLGMVAHAWGVRIMNKTPGSHLHSVYFLDDFKYKQNEVISITFTYVQGERKGRNHSGMNEGWTTLEGTGTPGRCVTHKETAELQPAGHRKASTSVVSKRKRTTAGAVRALKCVNHKHIGARRCTTKSAFK